MEDEVLTKDEVLKQYKIGRFILDKAMKSREITYFKLERKVLFKRSAAETWLHRNIVQAVDEKDLKKIKRKKK